MTSKKKSEWGKVGAALRKQKLSPERRKEIARNAAKARWAKKQQPPQDDPPT